MATGYVPADAEALMDSVNNNTMSNNNNSSNINNNVSVTVPCMASDEQSTVDGTTCSAAGEGNASGAASSGNNSGSRRSAGSARDSSSSSRRSHSSGRSRSRHRRSHGSSRRSSRHHSRQRHKQRERNFPSALCSMITIVILSTALAEPRWIHIEDGSCRMLEGKLTYLGAFQFLYNGHFIENGHTVFDIDQKSITVITNYKYGPLDSDCMFNCITDKGVLLFKAVISFTFLAIVCSLCAFLIDLIGPSQRVFKLIRRSAIFNVITVILCVVVTLFMYWITAVILTLQQEIGSTDVQVSFDVSFYLITAAGVTSVVAVAFCCLRRYPLAESEAPSPRAILDDQFNEDTENLLALPPPAFHNLSAMAHLPPPPPYTP